MKVFLRGKRGDRCTVGTRRCVNDDITLRGMAHRHGIMLGKNLGRERKLRQVAPYCVNFGINRHGRADKVNTFTRRRAGSRSVP